MPVRPRLTGMHRWSTGNADALHPKVAPNETGPDLSPVDAVFILGRGRALDYDDGEGVVGWIPSEGPWAGVPATGWVWHEDDAVLVHLLMWLDLAMPRINRVAPIAKHCLNRAMRGPAAGPASEPSST